MEFSFHSLLGRLLEMADNAVESIVDEKSRLRSLRVECIIQIVPYLHVFASVCGLSKIIVVHESTMTG